MATVASISATLPGAHVLTAGGLGSVKVGMTVRQAERALGAKLHLTSYEDLSGQCLRGSRTDGVDPGQIYMALKGIIQRIDVQLAFAPTVKTPEGIGAGASPGLVKQTYGAQAQRDQTDPNADPDNNNDLVVDTPDHKRGIQFKFEHGKLTWMVAGNYPALSYYEGCL